MKNIECRKMEKDEPGNFFLLYSVLSSVEMSDGYDFSCR